MIPICYCGNRRIFKGVLLSAMSVIKNTDDALDIILCTMDLSDICSDWLPFTNEQAELVDRLAKNKNKESRARILDMTDAYLEHLSGGANARNLYTPYATLRLLLDLYEVGDKLIYLDADVMCRKNINELYSIDIKEYELAAALDKMGHFWINKAYCNSGVLLMNMDMIKNTKLFERARELIKRKRMVMPDQSALNELASKKLILPYRFNEQRDIKTDTVIKHFCKGFKLFGIVPRLYNYKQWDIDMVHKRLKIFEFDDIYEEYDLIIKGLKSDILVR